MGAPREHKLALRSSEYAGAEGGEGREGAGLTAGKKVVQNGERNIMISC